MPLLKLEERPSPGALDLPSRVIAYISGNFRQPISLDDVAKQVGASKCHVSRIFSSKLHTDFHSYVNSFRLNLAQNLLCNTDLDILTISQECGFENQRTFNRVFQRRAIRLPASIAWILFKRKNCLYKSQRFPWQKGIVSFSSVNERREERKRSPSWNSLLSYDYQTAVTSRVTGFPVSSFSGRVMVTSWVWASPGSR